MLFPDSGDPPASVFTGDDDASETKTSHTVHVIKEFIETEQKYLLYLDIIVDHVMKPLAQREVSKFLS